MGPPSSGPVPDKHFDVPSVERCRYNALIPHPTGRVSLCGGFPNPAGGGGTQENWKANIQQSASIYIAHLDSFIAPFRTVSETVFVLDNTKAIDPDVFEHTASHDLQGVSNCSGETVL